MRDLHHAAARSRDHGAVDIAGETAQTLRLYLFGGFRVAAGARVVADSEWCLRKVLSLRRGWNRPPARNRNI